MKVALRLSILLLLFFIVLITPIDDANSFVYGSWTTTDLKTPEESMASLGYNTARPFYAVGYHYVFYTNYKYHKLCYAVSSNRITYATFNIETPEINYSTWNAFADWYDPTSNTVYLLHNEGENATGYALQRYLYLKRGSPAGVISWSNGIEIEHNATQSLDSYNICKVGSGRLYAVYARSPTGGNALPWYRYSDDNGDSWSSPQQISALNPSYPLFVLPYKNSTSAIILYFYGNTLYHRVVNGGVIETAIAFPSQEVFFYAISNQNLEVELLWTAASDKSLNHRTLFTNGTWSSNKYITDPMGTEPCLGWLTRTSYGFRLYYSRLNASDGKPYLWMKEYYSSNRTFFPSYQYPPNNEVECQLGILDTGIGYWDYYLAVNYAQDSEGEFSPVYWVEYPDLAGPPYWDHLHVSNYEPTAEPYFLAVTSEPLNSIHFTINGATQITPYNTSTASTYLLSVESRLLVNSTVYYFQYWDIDGINYYDSTVLYSFQGTKNVTANIHLITSKPKLYPPPKETPGIQVTHDFRTPFMIIIGLIITWAICRSARREWLAAIPILAVVLLALMNFISLCTYTNYILIGLVIASIYLLATYFISRYRRR